MTLHFAPLQGYTDHLYRRFHAEVYGAADAYYTPFIRVEKGEPRRQDMARLLISKDDGLNLVPQIIFNSFEEFRLLTDAVKDAGYHHIDLNLGCPYPMQTRKGRGTAMLHDIGTMRSVIDAIKADNYTEYSVKMRLGMERPDEWKEIMPLLNEARLKYITVHPRIAKQMYGGELYPDEFMEISQNSSNPLIWNGDIHDVADIDATENQFPWIYGIMIGRGMLARPSLIAEWRTGEVWSQERRVSEIMNFHSLLFDAYSETLCGDAQILQKIKPFWDYLEPEIGHKSHKTIKKATSIAKYRVAIDNISV